MLAACLLNSSKASKYKCDIRYVVCVLCSKDQFYIENCVLSHTTTIYHYATIVPIEDSANLEVACMDNMKTKCETFDLFRLFADDDDEGNNKIPKPENMEFFKDEVIYFTYQFEDIENETQATKFADDDQDLQTNQYKIFDEFFEKDVNNFDYYESASIRSKKFTAATSSCKSTNITFGKTNTSAFTCSSKIVCNNNRRKHRNNKNISTTKRHTRSINSNIH